MTQVHRPRSLASVKAALPLFAAMALAGCGSLIPDVVGGGSSSASARAEGDAPARTATRTTTRRVTTQAPSFAGNASDRTCLADLRQAGASFRALPDAYAAPGCNKLGTVQLASLAGDRSSFGISNIGAVKCDVANAFGQWARFGVDRAARQILGSPLDRIETMGSYACRNIAGSTRRSAHARAEAIDVSAFWLKDGRRIVLRNDWDGGTAAEREFLRTVHRSACKRFGTVLGPEYNAAHADHFHLEGTGTGSGFCR